MSKSNEEVFPVSSTTEQEEEERQQRQQQQREEYQDPDEDYDEEAPAVPEYESESEPLYGTGSSRRVLELSAKPDKESSSASSTSRGVTVDVGINEDEEMGAQPRKEKKAEANARTQTTRKAISKDHAKTKTKTNPNPGKRGNGDDMDDRRISPSPGDTTSLADQMEEGQGRSALDSKLQQKEARDRYLSLFAPYSFGCLSISNPVRRTSMWIVESNWFNLSMFLAIIVNSIFLGMYDPIDTDSRLNQVIDNAEEVFLIIFTGEAILKLIAYGVYWEGPRTYFKVPWNVLDMIIVIAGWTSFALTLSQDRQSVDFNSIRVLRVLRPLRAIRSIPGLSLLTGTLLRSLQQLLSVVVIAFFYFVVFGLIGVIFFKGKLHQRCFDDDTGVQLDEGDRLCTLDTSLGGRVCPDGSTCKAEAPNPYSGAIHFDHIGGAFLVVFTAMTFENWTTLTYMLADTTTWYAQFYFVALVIMGALMLVNVLVAVVAVNYTITREISELADTLNQDEETAQILYESRMKQQGTADATFERDQVLEKKVLKNPPTEADIAELRLIASYEMNRDNPNYSLLSSKEYKHLKAKHRNMYKEWKEAMLPRIKAMERDRINEASKAAQAQPQDPGSPSPIGPQSLQAAQRKLRPISINATETVARLRQHSLDGTQAQPYVRPNGSLTSAGGTGAGSGTVRDTKPADDGVDASSSFKPTEQGGNAAAGTGANADSSKAAPLQSTPSKRKVMASNYIDSCVLWITRNIPCFGSSSDAVVLGAQDDAPTYRKKAYAIVTHKRTESMITLVILINTIAMAAEHFPQPAWLATLLFAIYVFVICSFAVEVMLKFAAFGVDAYFREAWNRFDFLVVFLSMLEILIPQELRVVSALRVFLLLRLIRLAKYFPNLERLVITVGKTVKSVFPFTILLCVFLFIFAVVGIHLFGGKFEIDPEEYDCTESYEHFPHCPPRAHFDGFLWAFITSFQILTLEEWPEVMANAVEDTSWWSVFYFVISIGIGSFIVLNLFLGVLIDAFLNHNEYDTKRNAAANDNREDENENENEEEKQEEEKQEEEKGEHPLKKAVKAQQVLNEGRFIPFSKHPSYEEKSLWVFSNRNPVRLLAAKLALSKRFDRFIVLVILASSIMLAFDNETVGDGTQRLLDRLNLGVAFIFAGEAVIKILAFGFVVNRGAYLRDPWNALDFFIVVAAFLGVLLAQVTGFRTIYAVRALRPLRLIRTYDGLKTVVVAIGKSVVPVLQLGAGIAIIYFIFGIFAVNLYGGTYRASWECPLPLAGDIGDDPKTYKEFCESRDTEGLLPESENEVPPPVRNYTESMCRTYPAPYNVDAEDCPPDQFRCSPVTTGRNVAWSNPTFSDAGFTFHFDHVGMATLVLFEISSLEIWYRAMYAATDAVGVGQNPVRGSNDLAAFSFIFFLVVSNLLFLQLFIAVIVDSFQQGQDKVQGKIFLTEKQHQWVEMQRRAAKLKIKPVVLPPDKGFQRWCFFVTKSPRFEKFILYSIAINTAIIMLEHYDQPYAVTVLANVGDVIFGIIFIVEAGIKISGLGYKVYFRQVRNVLDFVVVLSVIASWLLLLVSEVTGRTRGEEVNFMKSIEVFRAFRVVKLLTFSKGVESLLRTISVSLPSLFNVSLLIAMMLYVFATMGMQLFGGARNAEPPIQFSLVNDYANFENLGNSMITLMRMATGEEWNGIMRELAQYNPLSLPFAITFVLLVQFALINLFVAVILSDLEVEIGRSSKEESSIQTITPLTLSAFSRAWAFLRYKHEKQRRDLILARRGMAPKDSFYSMNLGSKVDNDDELSPISDDMLNKAKRGIVDNKETAYLPATDLSRLLELIPPPIGILGVVGVSQADKLRLCKEYSLPVNEHGKMQFYATLVMLIDKSTSKDVISRLNDMVEGRPYGEPDPNAGLGHGDQIVPRELIDMLMMKVPKKLAEQIERTRSEHLKVTDNEKQASAWIAQAKLKGFLKRCGDKKRQGGQTFMNLVQKAKKEGV